MEITIRKAIQGDIAEILQIINDAILNTTANYNYEIQTLDEQQRWFEEKEYTRLPVLVASFGGKTVGFCTYGKFREKIGYQFTVEHSIYVSPEFTGKGAGKLLLSSLIEIAKQQGYHTMIGGIDASNRGSIDFHKRFGFTECGVIKDAGFKFGRWLDLLFMQLILK